MKGGVNLNEIGFSYILNSLNISPSKMGKELNIDRTLVSKWKNGSRKIDFNAIYFDKALSFLIKRNLELGNNFLENLFSSIYNESINNSNYEEHLRELLKKFIVEDTKESNLSPKNKAKNNFLYTSTVSIYNTDYTSCLGILDMLDSAIDYGKPQKLYCLFNKSFDSFIDNIEFRVNWLEKMKKLLDIGCNLDFLYSSSKSSKLLSYITPLLFHKNCKASYFIDSFDDTYNYSLHIIENNSVFISSCEILNNRNYYYGALFTDPVSINFYIAFTKNTLSKSINMFFPATISEVITTFELNRPKLNKELIKYNTSYYYNSFPIHTVISDELYYDILCNSVNDKDDRNKFFENFKLSKKNMYEKSSFPCIHFYSIEQLLKLSNSEIIIYGSDSDCSPKLFLTKEQFKMHLDYLANYLLSVDNYNICLISDSSIVDTELFHCWCKKNEFLLIFDSDNLLDVRLCTDNSYVNSVAYMFEQYLTLAKENLKDKNIVANFLRSL